MLRSAPVTSTYAHAESAASLLRRDASPEDAQPEGGGGLEPRQQRATEELKVRGPLSDLWQGHVQPREGDLGVREDGLESLDVQRAPLQVQQPEER